MTVPLRGAALGLVIALLGNFLFTTSDAIVKSMSARYSVFQLIAMQVGFACIPLLVILGRDGTFSRLRVRHPFLVSLRGLLAGLNAAVGFHAFSLLPLAEVYSIAFCAPLIVTLASIPLLGEQVGLRRLAAVLVGFAGILVMVRPGFVALSLGHLAALANAFMGASVVLIMRRIAREEERGVMVSAVMIGLLAVSVPPLFWVGRVPLWQDVALMALSGLIMGTAQFVVLEALRRAPAASVAPMQYTMLVWALIYGVAIFGDPIRPNIVLGAAIVIASSLYIMHRERLGSR